MTNSLRALLPIHAMRERRALQLVHAQFAAHERASEAQANAMAEQARLSHASAAAFAALENTGPLRADAARWLLFQSKEFAVQADGCNSRIEQLAAESQRTLEGLHAARDAHAARGRSHRKVREASQRMAVRAAFALDAAQEQRADDDHSTPLFTTQSPTLPS